MHRRLLIAAATGLLVLPITSSAEAKPLLDRVQVGAVKRHPGTKRFSPALAVTLKIPSGYERSTSYDGMHGAWIGPPFVASNPSFSGDSTIVWGVDFVRGRSLSKLAKREGRDYPKARARSRKVRHVIGRRTVGKLKAYAVLDAEKSPGARVEGTLAIGISHRTVAIVSFNALDPAVDDAGSPGKVTVKGRPAGDWNRKQVNAAFSRVYIEGNLPPSKVKARVRGRRITGSLRDAFGDPVVDTAVALKAGRHTVATASTNSHGAYKVSAPRRGRYRVVGTLQGYSAKSKTVRVG